MGDQPTIVKRQQEKVEMLASECKSKVKYRLVSIQFLRHWDHLLGETRQSQALFIPKWQPKRTITEFGYEGIQIQGLPDTELASS